MTAKKPAPHATKSPATKSPAKAPAKAPNKKGTALDNAELDKVAGGGNRTGRGTVVVNGG